MDKANPGQCPVEEGNMTDAIEKFKEQGGDILHLAPSEVTNKLRAIEAFQQIVHKSLTKDLDYGIIPGTQKPTLLKPGAEKIAKLLNLADTYEVVDKVEDWSKPFFSYTVRCTLTEISSGAVVCSYLANCNSYESKYRYRMVPSWKLSASQKSAIDAGGVHCEERPTARGAANFYRFENEDIYSQVNTIMKMSEKRAMVSAVLSVGRLSLLFTVDMEDYKPEEQESSGEGARSADKGPSGDEAANVRPPASGTPPPPISKPKSVIENGRYSDDVYPIDLDLRLPDGTTVSVSKFKALELFEKMKKAIGEERYYEVLSSCKYNKVTEIPVEEMHLVYSLLVGEWNKTKGKRK